MRGDLDELIDGRLHRTIMSASLGNLVEWFEFALFGAFATTIAATFFPPTDDARALTATFGVFGVAFLARPLGALGFAHFGDRLGRRRALAVSLLLMTVATAGVGVLPSYERVGWVAPVLLLLLRMVQGAAVGGEFGGSAALVVEHSPQRHRGWYGGWHWSTTGTGLAIGIGAAGAVGAIPDSWPLHASAWRLPFLLAVPLGFVGLYVRTRVDESPMFRTLRRAGAISQRPLRDAVRDTRPQLLVGFTAVAAVAATFNLMYVFVPNHLVVEGRLSLGTALGTAVAGPLVAAVVAPWFGRLSDRVGRRAVVLAGMVCLLVAIPIATLLVSTGGVARVLIGFVVVGLPLGVLALSAFLAELFPTRLRHSGISLTYGLATALMGGTTPLVASVLVRFDGGLALPAAYAMAVVAVALAALLAVPHARTETRSPVRGLESGLHDADVREGGDRTAAPATGLPSSGV